MKHMTALTIASLIGLGGFVGGAASALSGPSMGRGGDMDRLAVFDQNGDGAIARSEVLADLEEQFSLLDGNGNGFLTLDEMPVLLPVDAEQQGRIDSRVDQALRRAERKGLTVEEADLRQRFAPTRLKLVAHHDQNADEQISFEEFTARALRRFDHADANTDGVVSAEEREEISDRMKGRGRRR